MMYVIDFVYNVVDVMCSRFDGQDFLSRYKGKKILFVGDSLSNNMWVSLTCMLHSAAPISNYSINRRGQLSTFFMQVYCNLNLERLTIWVLLYLFIHN